VPILCYVTDRRGFSKGHELDACEALLHKIQEAAAAGVDWIQVREKGLSGKECAALTNSAIERAASKQGTTRILVNDRLDVALSQAVGGVHHGEYSLPVEKAQACGFEFVWRFPDWCFCHSVEAAIAAKGGANYIFSVPHGYSFSHGHREACGLAGFASPSRCP
jgi:hypothetical protein